MSAAYRKFWETCTDAYVFGIDVKKELPIVQLVDSPPKFNIRVKEDNIVRDMLNYLVNMPDKSTKQTLCVMPIGQDRRPTKWDEIKNSLFYIINGQHSVAASRLMMEDDSGIDDDTKKHFESWKCFVVWSEDADKLRSISAYYNRVNHFQAIQPSWATNILGARIVWVNMGSPKHPKEATVSGSVQAQKKTRETANMIVRFKVGNSGRSDLNRSLMIPEVVAT